jgi:hypothetical protein
MNVSIIIALRLPKPNTRKTNPVACCVAASPASTASSRNKALSRSSGWACPCAFLSCDPGRSCTCAGVLQQLDRASPSCRSASHQASCQFFHQSPEPILQRPGHGRRRRPAGICMLLGCKSIDAAALILRGGGDRAAAVREAGRIAYSIRMRKT